MADGVCNGGIKLFAGDNRIFDRFEYRFGETCLHFAEVKDILRPDLFQTPWEFGRHQLAICNLMNRLNTGFISTHSLIPRL